MHPKAVHGGRPFVLLLPLVACLALGVACDAPAGGAPRADAERARRGGTAVLGSISDVDAWNEYVSQQSFAGNLLRRIFLRLAQETGHGIESPRGFEPLLAESWEFSDDGLSLTFHLRPARWSDGVEITADDVRFTWTAQTSPEVPWVGADSKRRIHDVEVLDARTVRFHYDGVYPYQLADAVEGGIVPRHVFGRVPFERWATHDWSSPAIGSGPFVLERHVPQQQIDLVRNPYYFHQGYPLLDRVIVRVVPDDLSLLTQLETGELDYLEGIPPRDAHRLDRHSGDALSLIVFESPQYDYIGWNASRPPFDRREVRLAMTLALDRRALIDDLLYGYGRPSKGPVPGSWWGADRTFEPWPHDPERARSLLRRNGFSVRDAAGVRSPGRELRFEMITNSGNRVREQMLVKIQEQLSRIGVRVLVRPLEMRTLRQEVIGGAYDAYLGGWTFVGKVDLGSLFASSAIPPERGLNVVRYRSAEVDRLLGRLGEATDWRAMEAPLHALQRQIHQDQPYTFLYERSRVAAHGPRLHGVTIDVPGDPLAGLERFWVAEP